VEKVVLGFVEAYRGVKVLVGAKGVVGGGEIEICGGGAGTGVKDRGWLTRDALEKERRSGG